MIPIIYESTEVAFISNGLARLRDCLSAVCVEERNNIFELDFTYPVTGANFDLIQCGRIVAVTHDDTGDVQPFDIVSYSKPINGVVTFHCVHVSYRQTGMVATGSNINRLTDAFNLLKSATPTNPFNYETDITSGAYMAAADGIPHSVRQLIGGMEGSILDTYGGELQWDRFTVRLLRARGQLRDFTIRYGLNMTDYIDETDYSETYTTAIPYWKGNDTNGGEVIVVGNKATSGNASYNGREQCISLDLSDKFETKPTKAQLKTQAESMIGNAYLPQKSIKVDFLRLQDMGEYDQYKSLLTCQLCDSVRVLFPAYNMEGTYKIVKTEWDVLLERYNTCELGSLSTTLAEALGVGQTSTTTLIEGGGGGSSFTPTLEEDNGTKTISTGTTLRAVGINKTLPSGYWIVTGTVRYTSSDTGYRSIAITENGTQVAASLVQHPAGGTGNVDMKTTAIIRAEAAWVFDLQVRQNSGSSMSNVPWYYQAIKVGEA